VPGAYAVYVVGASMEPRYHPSEVVHIHPGKPLTVGAYVLVQRRPKNDGEPPLAVIKRLAKRTGAKIVLEQFNPAKTFEIKTGDIVSIDCGVVLDGYFGDSAITVAVGGDEAISPEHKKLLEVTEASLKRAIEKMRIGNTVGDVGAAVQDIVEAAGFSVVREFVGHGIGTKLHEDPQVPNYGEYGMGMKLREGMVFAIEPMVNAGKPGSRVLDDHWTAVTEDGSYSAHFEHCVAVTKNGPLVLTA